MANLIKVKPIDTNNTWHGKKGYESFRKPKTIQAFVDSQTRTYKTGLNNTIPAFADPTKIGSEEKTLTEQQYYSLILKADLSNEFIDEKPHPFWDSKVASIKLENRTMLFNPDIPLDYIKIRIMKTSKFVANSLEDYNNGLYPEATHIIYDENEGVEEKAKKLVLRNNAIALITKLTKEDKINLVTALSLIDGDNIYKAKVLKDKSETYVDVELNKYVENYPEAVIKYYKQGKDRITTEALVIECLQRGHLTKEGHRILYFDSPLGDSVSEVTDYLMIDKNQDLKIRLKALIDTK